MDEQDAIERCRAGERNAFAVLVGHHQASVLALCLRMTGNHTDALDLSQQAFIKAYEHLDQYDSSLPFRPWLLRIATNECIACLRRKEKQAVPVAESTLERTVAEDAGLAALAGDRERVRHAVAKLPVTHRTVVFHYYFEQLSYLEIAQRTGVPVGTVGTYLHRAKQQLHRILSEQEGPP